MHPAAISPIAVALLIFGIFMLVVPPVGVLLIVAAYFVNRSYRRSRRCYRNNAQQRAHDKAEARFMAAARRI